MVPASLAVGYLGDFGLTLLSIVLMLLFYFFVTAMQVYKRRQVFTEDYMQQFAEEHHRAFGSWKPPKLGYPDMGSGRYSKDLTYSEWFIFNNWQRCHYNFLEQLTPILIWILISCLYNPLSSGILGLIYLLGRILYTFGYMSTSNKRIYGAIIMDLSLLGLFVLSLVAIGSL